MIDERGNGLIFLISQPRAGSTLLQLMLSGHSGIATTSEPWIALHPLYALREDGVMADYDPRLAYTGLSEFLAQSGADMGFYKKRLAAFLSSLYAQAASHQGKEIFLDKTPRYYYIIDELTEVFPEAKILVLLRNPLAVLNSILKTWVKDDIALLGYYRDDLTLAPVKLIDGLKKHPRSCHAIQYEELVSKPEDVLKEACSFLGIGYEPAMLEYGSRNRPDWKLGDPVGVHKASRPTPDSLDSWKKELGSAQEKLLAASYLEALGPKTVKGMGYDYKGLKSAVGEPASPIEGMVTWEEAMSNFNNCLSGTDNIKKQRDALLNSLSWRVTAPLRAIANLFIK